MQPPHTEAVKDIFSVPDILRAENKTSFLSKVMVLYRLAPKNRKSIIYIQNTCLPICFIMGRDLIHEFVAVDGL